MTIEEWEGLTPEEQRYEIAELCGYTNLGEGLLDSEPTFWGTMGGKQIELPDYLNDLNACHEFEEKADQDLYWPTLWEVINDAEFPLCENQGQFIDALTCVGKATAEQRCEAFCLTMESE